MKAEDLKPGVVLRNFHNHPYTVKEIRPSSAGKGFWKDYPLEPECGEEIARANALRKLLGFDFVKAHKKLRRDISESFFLV